MKKRCLFFLRVKKVLLLLTMLLSVHLVRAQVDIAIGTGTTGNIANALAGGYPCPIQDYYEGSRQQYLYRASELQLAGMNPGLIHAIKFNIIAMNGFSGNIQQYTIKMGATSITTLGTGATWETVPTTIFGPIDYVPVAGMNVFTLSTPFVWNGSDNIIIEICNGAAINDDAIHYTQNPTIAWTTDLPFNGSHNLMLDNVGNLCSSTAASNAGTQTTRPNIVFSWSPSGACTDPPTAGTLVPSANPACAGTNFTLSTSGASFGTGQTYLWQSSPDNVNWTNLTGTDPTLTTSQTAATYYRLIVTCGSGKDTTNSLLVGHTLCYCTSIPTSNANEEITSFTLNGNTNNSDCFTAAPGPGSIAGRYSNYVPMGSFANLITGITVDFNLQVTECDALSAVTHGCAIWIDFNHDGDFNDPDEKVYSDVALHANPRTIFGNITVPPSALPGTTVMRIIVASTFTGNALQPCMTYTNGETEDYLINIIPAIPCDNITNAGTATATPSSACVGQTITLTNTGASLAIGQDYQWQVSTDNGANWNDIPGAINFTATVTQPAATTWYRFKITCQSTGDAIYSSVTQVVTPPTPGGTYTINKNETNPANIYPNGSVFTSFKSAYDAIKCGIQDAVIFNVLAGTGPYEEQLIMNGNIPNSTAARTVTFNGNGEKITFNTTDPNERAVIKLKNIQYIRFENLVIEPTGTTNAIGVHLTGDANFNIIRNCTVNLNTTSTGTGFAGIAISGNDNDAVGTGTSATLKCDNNEILNNTIKGGYYGMTLASSFTAGAHGNNRFFGNKVTDFYAYGLYVNGTFSTTVDSNFFSRPTRTGTTSGTTVNAIYFNAQNNTASVTRNRISNPFGAELAATATFYGINFNNSTATITQDNQVINNLIYKMNGNGVIHGLNNVNSGNIMYAHNTVSIDSLNTASAVTRGFSLGTAPAGGNVLFFDNLISITRNGPGAKHAIYAAGPAITGDYNNFYRSVTGATGGVGYFTTDRLTLDDWKLATGGDGHSLSVPPVFANPNDGIAGYIPGNGGLDNQGLYLGFDKDLLNVTRPFTNPDIGAFEFTPPTCAIPPVNGATTITPSGPVCQGTYIQLNLNIGPYGSGQNFQWQSSTTSSGPWTNVGNPKLTPDTLILANTTLYYRAIVSCGAAIDSSSPVAIQVTPALPAGTYKINKALPTDYVPGVSGPGANFNSFNDAKAAMAQCGILGPVVFEVEPNSGPYQERLKLDSIKNTSAINTITFRGNGNTIQFHPAVAAHQPTTNDRAVIKLDSTDYVTFDSLIIDAASGGFAWGYGVQLIHNADNNNFTRCTIMANATSTSSNYNGVVINSTDAGSTTVGNTWCDNNTFDRNTITGGFYGITVVGGTNPTDFINDNRFTRNTIRDFYTGGIYIAGTYNNLVEANNISRPTRTTVASPSYGIYTTGANSQRLQVSKNRIHHLLTGAPTSTSTQYGIYFNAVDAPAGNNNTVSNNVIHDLEGNGPIYALYNTGSDGVRYYHNTISLDYMASTTTSATRGFYQTTQAAGIEFVNNIITIRRGGTGAKHGIYLETATSEVHSDYNVIFPDGLGGNNYVGFNAGTNLATLADWRTATGGDANSFSINPLFKSPATGDYSAGLEAINNKGIWVGISTDVVNAARNGLTPDIGAWEFTALICDNPPVAGTASVTPVNNVCMETPIALTLAGHSPLGSLKFQWQSAPTASGPWTNISPILYTPEFYTIATADTFFRAAVTCGNGTPVYSTVTGIHLAPVVFAGTYTIDNSAPTTWPGPPGSNFNSFNAAVAAMSCGITGPVVFNVRPGTTAGVYNEQVSIPYIKNSSAINTITFQSESGDAASINLTFASATAPDNYTLRLDSTRWVTFRNLTLSATNTSFGRVVDFTRRASNNTITQCIINAPTVTTTSNTVAGIYTNGLRGTANTIKHNTINNGAMGIYFWGVGVAGDLSVGHVIDSNTVNGAFSHGINVNYQKRLKLTGNTVNVSAGAPNVYGIYASDIDSAYTITYNKVNINNATTTVYGMYINNCDTASNQPKALSSNTITGVTGNSGALYGLYITGSPGHESRNNVIALNTSSTTTYGLYSINNTKSRYYNNSINISSPAGAVTNAAAYFNTDGSPDILIRNNIFSNKGSGRAMVVTTPNRPFAADYNMLYAAGSVLVQSLNPAGSYPTLQAWVTASYWDRYSIVYPPAFVSNSDLHPNLNNPDVWAMHGRGVQIAGNSYDFNNNPRPTTLTSGVPDLGAFEFYPTSLPTLLSPVPAGPPAPGLTQAFLYGTDTVTTITWGANVPPTAGVRRYSGVVPSGLMGPDSMYFYTQVETPGDYNYSMSLNYLDPWQGSIPEQWMIGLGRTTPGNSWIVGYNSRVTVPAKRITQSDMTYMNKFTGLINPYAPPVLPDKDSSNRGRNFWVAYAINQLRTGSNQEMVLYLSAQEPANVTVRIAGTSWVRNYVVPANTVLQTEFLPKAGPDNAFLNEAGLYQRGINIESDVPIVVYAHATGSASSGAAMLLPVSTWGYEYKMLGISQNYGGRSYSYFYAVADHDNTVIEVTPTVAVQNAGMAPGVPYTVTLNRGDVFQVVASSETQDLTGSTVKSIPNSNNVCNPVAVFSGTSRTALSLPGCGSGGDFMMQQNFPATAWGKHYLTAPSSASTGADVLRPNIYRVAVKDPATVVKRNGTPLTGLINNHYYQFESSTADYIESDKPVMMAQYLTGACSGYGVGDPEMIYISPIEQGINNIGFYRNDRESIDKDFLTMIIPTNGLASLVITDGAAVVAPDYVYPHPQNGAPSLRGVDYSVVVKMWDAAQQQVRVYSDSSFTAITYGLGSVESYGYNAGTLVKNINATGTISNTLNTLGGTNEFTCVGSSFRFSATLQLVPEVLTFKLSNVPNLSPNADVTILNPVPVDTIQVNWTSYYVFELPNEFSFSAPGIYPVQIVYQHPDIEGCDHEGRDIIYVQVVPAPITNFQINFPGCVGGTAQFTGEPLTANGLNVSQWEWTFHNGTSTSGQTTTFTYPSTGSFDVNLHTVTPDGCVGDNTQTITVNPKPTVAVAQDSLTICAGTDAVFTIQNPVSGVNYVWYYLPVGGTPIDTTATFTVTGLTSPAEYYVEAVTDAGCVSDAPRKRVAVGISTTGAAPAVTVTATGPDFVTFSWQAIPGASGYEVSEDGVTFVTPSSGPTGLTHTLSGLSNLETVTLIVKSINSCGEGVSVPVSGCASTPVQVADPSLAVCEGTDAVFNVQNPVAGVSYTWYNALSGGTVVGTGSSFTSSNVLGASTYYVEQQLGTCIGAPRTPVTVSILPPLDQPVAVVDSIGVNALRFRWNAVPGAAGYLVSTDGGVTFITPSSGPAGLTHTVTGLQPAQEVTLIVKAVGSIVCQESVSQPVTGRTWLGDIFIPNTFTPNGDGVNDIFKVYGNIIQETNLMVFNQWGEKIFHSRSQSHGWDGTYKGKPQPSGVYIVVAQFILIDGTLIKRQTSLNLIR